MAFTYRASEEEENIIATYMEEKGFTEKSKCLSAIVKSHKSLESQNEQLRLANDKFKKENAMLLSFLVKDETILSLDKLILELSTVKKEIVQFKKSVK